MNPAELYETFYVPGMFGPLADLFVSFAEPREGERVLDVACGSGVVARKAATRVGERGRVMGIDRNPRMIEVAKELSPESGAPIEWREGDAVELDVPDASFDLVLCQQGLQFFPDRLAALRHFRRALAPGGRVGVAVWRGIDEQGFWRAMSEVEARHLAPLGVTYEELVAPFSLGDPDALLELLEGAGFEEVEVATRTVSVRFPFENFVANTEGAYGAVIPEFVENPEAFEAFVAAVAEEIAPMLEEAREGDEIRFEMPTLLARAGS